MHGIRLARLLPFQTIVFAWGWTNARVESGYYSSLLPASLQIRRSLAFKLCHRSSRVCSQSNRTDSVEKSVKKPRHLKFTSGFLTR